MDTTIAAPRTKPAGPPVSWAWLGTLPFFLFVFAFLLLPSLTIMAGAFRNPNGNFTLDNIAGLFQPLILESYRTSIELSVVTAVVGASLGALLAYAITWGGLSGRIRSGVITFSSVAANFGGIPLAFAFITLLGRTGALPVFLRNVFGIDLYAAGFSIYTVQGLILAYLYFQFPLMLLIMVPAFDGLKREWLEAATNLGGTPFDFWRYVGLPILLPSFLGATVLLFGNAFGAYATAEALTGSKVDVVTRVISRQIRGDVLYNPGLSYALAFGMVVILAISIALYVGLQRVTARWLR
ncbi:MAG: ABC transporter [Candidatus Roseilinea sp.]|jgi:putative spermidine/putrescine transport system permease protein|uniref:Acriflavin resistance protein n=1 Tax=Candidatus Thermofonsia Clade 3 bacterium TaxID=2364212 RepID=A0A2M8QBV6_9CHLR|nr:ABC transporter permease subunit [Candidatus Roseilinea sp. NK_OTU-006]PJF47276.1 MAG: acriflavin resistance protein [Candidatus Thermofonsia Clade 3 bacterium]RMG62244.1 MAG: ABC transporter permease subunit [Chloroflexota bacterium]BCX04263.1 MAG: ABC transporter [Candidatus Roseilinea sp.]